MFLQSFSAFINYQMIHRLLLLGQKYKGLSHEMSPAMGRDEKQLYS